jgi:hypothetical protein
MKYNIYTTVLLLCLAFSGRAQQTVFDSVYFNNMADLANETEITCDIAKTGNYAATVILGRNQLTFTDLSFVSLTDSIGREKNRFTFNNDEQYTHNITSVCTINDQKLLVAGTYLDSASTDSAKMMIVFFSRDLDSLGFRLHPFAQEKGQFNRLIYDGGKYIYGTGYSAVTSTSYGNIFVTKLDTSGNLIWNYAYGLTNRNETGITLQLIGDDSLFVGGYNIESGNADGNALLLDTAGNQIWYRYIDIQNKENIFAGGYKHKDGGYVMPGQVYSVATGNDICFTKLNSSGIKEYDKIYSLGIKHDFSIYCFPDLFDSTIVAIGGNCNVPQFHEAGLAVKYTMEGDTMWTRTYDKSYNQSGWIDHFYRGIATNDSGYIFAGQTRSGMMAGKQDAWLLKTDSIGCNPNYPCWPATHYNYNSLPNYNYSSFNINIFPNPATSYVCVQFKNIQQNNACTLRLYTITGQLIKVQAYGFANPFVTLKMEEIEKGMYVLEVETLYGKERVKVIKE